MKRSEKIQAIRAYAKDLTELSKSYSIAAGIAERLPDMILDTMVTVSVEGNRIHQQLSDDLDSAMSLN